MFSCRQREGTPASQTAGADDDDGAATSPAALDQATDERQGAAGLDELLAQSAAAAERLRETEHWSDEAWVGEVRRLVDSWNRARLRRTMVGCPGKRNGEGVGGGETVRHRARW